MDPLLADVYLHQVFFDISFCVVLAATVYAVSQRKAPLRTAVILGLPAAVLTWLVYGFHPTSTAGIVVTVIRSLVYILFLASMAALILHYVFRGKRITGDKICGAICVYLFLGVAWACSTCWPTGCCPALSSIARGWPSFVGQSRTIEHTSIYIYYSFVTLTTLGYGDMTPVSAVVRTAAWLEAVTGQLYIAVLVARLVGLHIAQSGEAKANRRPPSPGQCIPNRRGHPCRRVRPARCWVAPGWVVLKGFLHSAC